MSLANCFNKAGKALSGKDRDAIESMVESGLSETEAVAQYLMELDGEIEGIATSAEEAGGTVNRGETLEQSGPFEIDFDNYPSMGERIAWYISRNPNSSKYDVIVFDDAVYYKQPDGRYTDDPRGEEFEDMSFESIFEIREFAQDEGYDLDKLTMSGKSHWVREARELLKTQVLEQQGIEPEVQGDFTPSRHEVMREFNEYGGVSLVMPGTVDQSESGYVATLRSELWDGKEDLYFGFKRFVNQHAKLLRYDNVVVGMYRFEDGRVSYDFNYHVEEQAEAEQIGRDHDQEAIYDVANGVLIETGGAGGAGMSVDEAEQFLRDKQGLTEEKIFNQDISDEQKQRFDARLKSGETGLEGAIDRETGDVTLTHFSNATISETEPGRWGQGLSGRTGTERGRIESGGMGRTYFGLQTTENPYVKEAGLGSVETTFTVEGERLYPLNEDPLNLYDADRINESEEMIRDAGYAGFWVDDFKLGKVAVVFEPLVADPVLTLNQAQRNDIGLYSGVEKAVLDMRIPNWKKEDGVASGKEIWQKLKKTSGVKQEELDWLGIEQFLMAGGKFTRDEVVQYIQDNGVKIEETVADEDQDGTSTEISWESREVWDDPEAWTYRVEDLMYEFDQSEQEDWMDRWLDEHVDDVVDNYRSSLPEDQLEELEELPDDEKIAWLAERYDVNDDMIGQMRDDFKEYAEEEARQEYFENPIIILTAGNIDDLVIFGNDDTGYSVRHGNWQDHHSIVRDDVWSESEAEIQAEEFVREEGLLEYLEDESVAKWEDYVMDGDYDNYRELKLTLPEIEGDFYYDVHFPDRNVLAFLRVNDRELNDKNTYFIDEFQSDWHQQGRQKGYSGDEDATVEAVPDAPFKGNNWLTLGLKRAIVDAVENGYEAIAWPNAQVLMDRWSEKYKNLYEMQYDTKMPSMVKKLTKQQPVQLDLEGNPIEHQEQGYWIIEITPELKQKVQDEAFSLFQESRGQLELHRNNKRIMRLGRTSDLSTFLHESAHLFLEFEKQLAAEFGTTENHKVLLEWLGAESFDDITVEHHEKFAETFEVYLREGKSPSLRLRDAFAAFARWLKRIYQVLNDPRLGRANLTPEIREVFDRMLATEAEIQEAMANPAYDEFFQSKEQAGMTDAEWEKYQKTRQKREDVAEQTLNEQLLKELHKRKSQEWEEEKAPIVEEEIERLSKEPTYQLLGDLVNFPMDYDILKEEVGFDKLPGKLIGKARKEDGVDPAEYAEAYGYKSVQAMYDDIVAAPPLKKAANEAAEARMIDKYGDVLNDGSIEQEAREAVHNDAQAELLLQELKVLGRNSNRPEINREYLKAEAKRIISTMTYREIKPTKFYNAEIRAAKKAVTSDDPYQAKVQQIVNHYLYREAVETKQRMERQRKYVRSVQRREYKAREVAAEYAQNMKTLANLYDLRSNTEKEQAVRQILEWYEAQLQDPNQLVEITLLDEFLIRGLEAKRNGQLNQLQFPTFDELTVAQLQGLHEMLRHMRYVGGKMSDEEKARRAAERQSLGESIIEHGGKDMSGTRGIPSDATNRRNRWSQMVNKIPSLRNMMRKLDGFDENGEAYHRIYQLVEEGNSRKIAMRRATYEQFETELSGIHSVGLSRKDNALKTYRLESGRSFSIHSESRFMMAVYWGTETSRDAIREGFGMTDRDVQTILSDLTVEQLELVNAVWKVNESMWPELSAASVRQYGVAPPKLDPTPFTVNGVQMTGGHMRLFYDSTEIELSNDRENSGSYASIMPTKAGSLHSRVGSGGKRPSLDRNNITRAMEDNIHFVAFADAGAELRSIINSDEVKDAIERKHGTGFFRAMLEAVDSITAGRPERETDAQLASMFRLLRRAATAKHLMYSVRNTVQQLGALPVATDEVGTVSWFGALGRYVADHNNFVNFINDRSEFMRDRASLVNREASEYLRTVAVDNKTEHIWNQFTRFGFTPQTIVDATVAYPLWMAKYEQSMEQHGDDKRAASEADTAVAESVGSGSDLHLGKAFHSTNTEWMRTFTMFGSWFNAYYQRVYRDVGRANAERSAAATYEAMRTLITTPIIVGVASAFLIYDGPDDDQEWYEWAAVNYGKFMAGTVPLLRDIASFTFDGFSPKTVWSGGAEAPVRFFNELTAYIEGKQTGLKTVVDISKVATTVVPVPGSGNVIRVADYIDSANQGKETDKGWFLNTYQAVTEGSDRNK